VRDLSIGGVRFASPFTGRVDLTVESGWFVIQERGIRLGGRQVQSPLGECNGGTL